MNKWIYYGIIVLFLYIGDIYITILPVIYASYIKLSRYNNPQLIYWTVFGSCLLIDHILWFPLSLIPLYRLFRLLIFIGLHIKIHNTPVYIIIYHSFRNIIKYITSLSRCCNTQLMCDHFNRNFF